MNIIKTNKLYLQLFAMLALSHGLLNVSTKLVFCSFCVVVSALVVCYIAQEKGGRVGSLLTGLSLALNSFLALGYGHFGLGMFSSFCAVFISLAIAIFLISHFKVRLLSAVASALIADTIFTALSISSRFPYQKVLFIGSKDMLFKFAYLATFYILSNFMRRRLNFS